MSSKKRGQSLDFQQDLHLARLLQEGKHEVFPLLMKLYTKKVQKIAFDITGSQSDAEDITQEVFLLVLEKIQQWQGENFRAWLFQIARRRSIDHIRKEKSQKRKYSPEVFFTPKDRLWEKEKQGLVQQVLENLPPGQKEIVILKHFQNLSIKEIAQHRKCAEGTVKATLFQAFQKLREEFRKTGLQEDIE